VLEVEMKFPAANFAALERRLAEEGAQPAEQITEADHYFNAPDRDFGQTDEALRVRRIGQANYVTYKGPKRDLLTKTRTEIEVGIEPGDQAAEQFMQLLQQLRYRPTAVVRKRRRIHRLRREGFALEVCLDDVERVGRFVELEIQAPEGQLDAARTVLLATAQAWGLGASERRSYLEMLLSQATTP
jgi:adenylate cyclase class 2